MQPKWYLQTWFICIMFFLSFFVIPFFIGIALLCMQYKENINSITTLEEANQYKNEIENRCAALIDSVENQINFEMSNFQNQKSVEESELNGRKAFLIQECNEIEEKIMALKAALIQIEADCEKNEHDSSVKCLQMILDAEKRCQEYDGYIKKEEKRLKGILTQSAKYADFLHENKAEEDNYIREQFDIIDYSLDGIAFENYFANLLTENGYHHVSVTSQSGDYGVDVIASKFGIKFAFQCKCYSQTVGNKSIQEVYSGMQYYQCNVGVVVTNNRFTDSARKQADSLRILLWGRNEIEGLLREEFKANKRLIMSYKIDEI